MNIRLALIAAAGIATLSAAPASASPVCLQPQLIADSKVISDTVIEFRMKNGTFYRNTLPNKCPGLKFEDGFRWDIQGGEVCSNLQTITVLRRGNTCMLGAFEKYTPPPPDSQN